MTHFVLLYYRKYKKYYKTVVSMNTISQWRKTLEKGGYEIITISDYPYHSRESKNIGPFSPT